MSRLLTTQRIISTQELFDDVAVTDFSFANLDALLFHRELKTQVRHDGGHERIKTQVVFFFHPDGQNRHDLVPINNVAFSIDS